MSSYYTTSHQTNPNLTTFLDIVTLEKKERTGLFETKTNIDSIMEEVDTRSLLATSIPHARSFL